MNVLDQVVTPRYALYNGDCLAVIPELPEKSIHISIYSPPFAGLFHYSSSERDLSNCKDYAEFMQHYEFVVRELFRVTIPGRVTAVHAMDVPREGANLNGGLIDFPGDIIRLHEKIGFRYSARYCIFKEPLAVRNRTMSKGLAHKQIVEDSVLCDNAGADFLLMFRKKGVNPIPVAHPLGLSEYAGERPIPPELMRYKGWKGRQIENRLSHLIWRRYASSVWDDIRIGHVLPYKEAREAEDEKHCHPLQLDVIDRCLTLWTNPGETMLTPFLGVGSEAWSAVRLGRKAIGIELKSVYFKQATRNLSTVDNPDQEKLLFDLDGDGSYDLSVVDSLITNDIADPDIDPIPTEDANNPPSSESDSVVGEPTSVIEHVQSPDRPAMYSDETATKPKTPRKKAHKESSSPLLAGMD